MAETQSTHIALTSTISPSKVVVLCVIAGYCAGVLPSRQSPSILESIVKIINSAQMGPTYESTESSLISFTLEDITARVTEGIIKSGTKLGLTGEETKKDVKLVRRILLKILWSIDNFDSLCDFIKSSEALIVENTLEGQQRLSNEKDPKKKVLTRTSFLGRFVHNILLSFKYLEFEKSVLLWKAFEQYRGMNEKAPAGVDNGAPAAKASLEEMCHSNDIPVLVIPQADLSHLIEHQIYLLESFGTPTPSEVSDVLKLAAKVEPGSLPSGHYIKYLECLKDNDFEGSFENLHRYFDYMMSSKARPLYHYALLSLATLYATFGCNQQAVSAIGEAIIVARENKDLTCLNYLLTWVYNFAKDRPHLELVIGKDYSDKHKILNFLRLRTKESKNKQLQSIFYQFRALQELNDGGQLPKIFEDLSVSAYLSLLYNENEGTDTIDFSIFAKSCQLISTLWLRLGVTALAEVYLDIGLDSSSYQHNVYDRVAISIKKAHIEFHKENYDACFKIFDDLEETVAKNGTLFKMWESRRLTLLVRLHLIQENYQLADALLSKVRAQTDTINDVDFVNEVATLKAMLDEATL